MPEYKVWVKDEEEPEDAYVFNARYHEEAAGEWADWHDRYETEYKLAGGNTVTVCVQEEGSTEIHEYEVACEMVPSFSANFKKVVGGENNG